MGGTPGEAERAALRHILSRADRGGQWVVLAQAGGGEPEIESSAGSVEDAVRYAHARARLGGGRYLVMRLPADGEDADAAVLAAFEGEGWAPW